MPVAVPLIAAGVGAAGTVAASNAQSKAAKSAANASQQATDASIAEQRRQFDIAQQNQLPYRNVGNSALTELAGLYGLSTGGGANRSTYDFLQANPDVKTSIDAGYFGGSGNYDSAVNWFKNEYGNAPNVNNPTVGTGQYGQATGVGSGGSLSPFFASPDYQFRQNEQMRALTARNASLGIQDSGAAQKAAIQYSGNLASGEFNNYANRLASLAGVGQTAANQSAQLGQNFANNFANLQTQNAQNLGSSYATQGANSANMWGNLAGIGSGLVNKYPFGGTSPTAPGGSLWGLF